MHDIVVPLRTLGEIDHFLSLSFCSLTMLKRNELDAARVPPDSVDEHRSIRTKSAQATLTIALAALRKIGANVPALPKWDVNDVDSMMAAIAMLSGFLDRRPVTKTLGGYCEALAAGKTPCFPVGRVTLLPQDPSADDVLKPLRSCGRMASRKWAPDHERDKDRIAFDTLGSIISEAAIKNGIDKAKAAELIIADTQRKTGLDTQQTQNLSIREFVCIHESRGTVPDASAKKSQESDTPPPPVQEKWTKEKADARIRLHLQEYRPAYDAAVAGKPGAKKEAQDLFGANAMARSLGITKTTLLKTPAWTEISEALGFQSCSPLGKRRRGFDVIADQAAQQLGDTTSADVEKREAFRFIDQAEIDRDAKAALLESLEMGQQSPADAMATARELLAN